MNWRERAACRDKDPEPVSETGPALLQITEAKAVCADCPVQQECLSDAIEAGLDFGVFGGATPNERRSPGMPAAA